MKRIAFPVAMFAAIIAAAVCLSVSRAEQPAPPDFSRVQVIAYASGLTGFFDTSTGTLYLYDSSLDKCVFIRKVTKLGDPLQVIRDPKRGG